MTAVSATVIDPLTGKIHICTSTHNTILHTISEGSQSPFVTFTAHHSFIIPLAENSVNLQNGSNDFKTIIYHALQINSFISKSRFNNLKHLYLK